jgi:hypothetical protein
VPGVLLCAQLQMNTVTGTPLQLRGCEVPQVAAGTALGVAWGFLQQYHDAFGMPTDLRDLRVLDVRHGLDSSHIRLQQTYQGIPVYDGYISIHLDRSRQIQVLHNRYRPLLQIDTDQPALSSQEALQRAKEAVDFQDPPDWRESRGTETPPVLVILLYDNTRGRLAWQVMLQDDSPVADWEVLIDAETGEMIKRYNRLVRDQAEVFDPSPRQQSGWSARRHWVWPGPELKEVTLQGLDGSGWLRGDYVDVTQPEGYLPAAAHDPSGEFIFDPDDPRFEEVMVYYHLDTTQRYIQSLGYSDRNEPPNGIRDRVTFASAHWYQEDQSFYSVADDALHFGDGGINDGEDAEIIVHEYGHALQHDQVVCWGGGEMDAIGEGFGDYLAASRFADVGDDPACVAEWDGLGYASESQSCLRRVDHDRHYPEDITGNRYHDGEIWSRVLWDLRGELGARVADTLALESHFYLPCDATMVDAAQALLDADDNIYGGAHRRVIERAILNRGLWSLPMPTIISPEAGDVLTVGEPVTVEIQPNHTMTGTYQLQYTVKADHVLDRMEVFEDGSMPEDFISYGNHPWQPIARALRSAPIDHRQSSILALSFEMAETGEFGFIYRVSTEQGWDFLELLLDGQLALRMSGEQEWASYRTNLEAGPHTAVWRYRKDDTMTAGEDAVWIDNLHIANVSMATWRTANANMSDAGRGRVIWQPPSTEMSTMRLRVRSVINGNVSPWQLSDRFTVGEPIARRPSQTNARLSHPIASPSPGVPWGTNQLGTLAGLAAFGVGATVFWRRRGR